MTLSADRWTVVSPSSFAWEQDALDYLRAALPGGSSGSNDGTNRGGFAASGESERGWHVWTNFEFIAPNGAIYEVDAAILTPVALWLVEIKSQPGDLTSVDGSWVFEHEGRRRSMANPAILANRKAKALKNALAASPAVTARHLPWVKSLIFLNGTPLHFRLEGPDVAHVALPHNKAAVTKGKVASVVEALATGQLVGATNAHLQSIDRKAHAAVMRGMETITRSVSARGRVGDYKLVNLLGEGVGYQDWEAVHQTNDKQKRRIRTYLVHDQATPEERERIRRAAHREANLLQGVRDQGLIGLCDLLEGDRGPALSFDFHPAAITLDSWLAERESALSHEDAYDLLERIAQAVRRAHNHRLVHRALSPQSILCLPQDGAAESEKGAIPDIKLINWQTAQSHAQTRMTMGTIHVGSLVDDRAAVYCAPESITDPEYAEGTADVFSLGCLAWRLFAGEPPAKTHLDVCRILQSQGGLKLSAALDGVSAELERLIYNATQGAVGRRSSIDTFLDDLEEVFNDLAGERPENLADDPLQAHKGEQLRDDENRTLYHVQAKLGRGASAVAYRLTADANNPKAKTVVAKIALGPEHAETLEAEYEILTKLANPGHPNIVQADRLTTIMGHRALILSDAGESLAARLRSHGGLQYDMLQRLGEDLLGIVDYLEREGEFHRDLKPDNLGIAQAGKNKQQTLIAFDFSLARAPLEKLYVGTRGYIDPFLTGRPTPKGQTPRYDTGAERYAAAITLYEMTTASLPAWVDGVGKEVAEPGLDHSASLRLQTDRFPAPVRDGLGSFFKKALHRKPEARFDNAREMAHAWIQVFQDANTISSTSEAIPDDQVTLETPLVDIGISQNALQLLERLGVTRLKGLLQLRRNDYYYIKGVTNQTRQEIKKEKKRWAKHFPDIEEADLATIGSFIGTVHTDDDQGPLSELSIDWCLDRILEAEPEGSRGETYLRDLLGLNDPDKLGSWPAIIDVARHRDVAQPTVNVSYLKVRQRSWKRSNTLESVRDDIHQLVTAHHGVLTLEEAADALLAQRGSREDDITTRRRMTTAVLRAGVDSEKDMAEPRFQALRGQNRVFLVTDPEWARYAERLGGIADELVAQLPPPSAGRVLEALRAIPSPGISASDEHDPVTLDARRQMALAAAASTKAALSTNRQELYPIGLPAEDALRLASGALSGLKLLTVADIQTRVRDRYPQAEHLPGRPRLDELLITAGLDLEWSAEAQPDPGHPDVRGAYARRLGRGTALSGSYSLFSTTSRSRSYHAPRDEDSEAVSHCHERLQAALSARGFLVVQTPPALALLAAGALHNAFPDLRAIDCDRWLIDQMHAIADRRRVKWPIVLGADAAREGTRDWDNLQRLVTEALGPADKPSEALRSLTTSNEPLLITNPGLLARYGRTDVIDALRDSAGTADGPPGVWILVPTGNPGPQPVIDHTAVPIFGANQALVLPKAWVAAYRTMKESAC